MSDKKNNTVETDIVGVNSHNIETNSLSSDVFFMSEGRTYTENISLEQTKMYIRHPMIYNRILREISRQAYNSDGMYSKVVDYKVAISTLNNITSLRNKNEKSKKAKKEINLIMKKINHKRTTRDIKRHLFVDGMYVGIVRDTSPTNKNIKLQQGYLDSVDKLEGLSFDRNLMIQPLDLDYCKIIGFQSNVSIAAFNLQYFDQFKNSGITKEIKNFPKEFQRAYLQYKKDPSKQWFKLDPKSTIALKARANEDEPYGRPEGLAAFSDIKFADDYADSQHKLIYELASSIYYLILPEGEKKGSCSLNPKQQEEVIAAFKNAVKVNTASNGAKISTLSLAPNTKIDRLSKDSSLLKDTLSDENLKKISTSLGFASSALNASSEGGASYASLQVNIDLISSTIFEMLDNISNEYTRVLNNLIGNTDERNFVDIKYLHMTILNQDKMYNNAKDLYTLGMGSLKYWIACAGFDPEDYLAMMEEELDEGIFERFTPHPTSFTISDSADKPNPDGNVGGRPEKDVSDMTDSGIKTRTNGGNTM